MKNDLYKKLLQLFILGYESETPSKQLYDLIKEGLGGVIFFAQNLKNRKNFTNTVQNLKSIAKTPPFLSIDQEGGLVERTIFLDKKVEYLTPKSISTLKNNDIKTHYDILAKDLASMGLNLNFAPVTDVNSNPNNPIIGVRSFGDNPQIVNKNAKIIINTFKENGIISCAKHYPGHGDTSTDSHKVMPVVNMNFDEFYKTHLICFEKAVKNGADSIMVSHVYFPFFEKTPTPSSLSKNAINYLKNELNFKGIIFSDDMVMGGISKNYGLKESIILALKAGIDSLIFRNASDELIEAINDISQTVDKDLIQKIENAYEKITNFKKKKLKNAPLPEFDTNKMQKIIDNLAKKTLIIQDIKRVLPLFKDKKIKIISFNQKEVFNLSSIENNLSDYIKGYDIKEIKYPLNPAKADIQKVLKGLNNTDTVIFISYNSRINSGQTELFDKINNPKILIGCGIENINTKKGNTLCSIFTHCYKTPILKALADILIKK